MSGHDTPPAPPSAYGVTPTGDGFAQHSVTISPAALEQAVATYRNSTEGQSPLHIARTLIEAAGTPNFGTIPHSETVLTEVVTFVHSHVEAMQSMGGVLDDFVSRVLAAAQIGREGNAATQQQAAQGGKNIAQ